MQRRLCLITGASAGIGAEFARQYAALGWDLVLTARRPGPLEALAGQLTARHGVNIRILADDLSDPSTPERLIGAIEQDGGQIDGLVNNAGYGLPGFFPATEWPAQAAFLQVMLTAPVELAWRVLPGMIARGYGRIVNVSSLAGYLPGGAGHTLYGGVKAGLIRFSESINAECRVSGHDEVRCSALCPGFTRTEFHDVNSTRAEMDRLPGWVWMDPAPVVRAGIEAVNRGSAVCVPGLLNKGLALVSRVVPEPAVRALVRTRSRAGARRERPG